MHFACIWHLAAGARGTALPLVLVRVTVSCAARAWAAARGSFVLYSSHKHCPCAPCAWHNRAPSGATHRRQFLCAFKLERAVHAHRPVHAEGVLENHLTAGDDHDLDLAALHVAFPRLACSAAEDENIIASSHYYVRSCTCTILVVVQASCQEMRAQIHDRNKLRLTPARRAMHVPTPCPLTCEATHTHAPQQMCARAPAPSLL